MVTLPREERRRPGRFAGNCRQETGRVPLYENPIPFEFLFEG